MNFFKFISDIFSVSVKADRIKSDEDKRAKSAHFAITGSIFALVALALAIGGGFIIQISNNSALVIFLIVIGVVFVFGSLVNYACALVRIIAQLRINKTAASYVALAVLILAFVGGIAGFFLLMTA